MRTKKLGPAVAIRSMFCAFMAFSTVGLRAQSGLDNWVGGCETAEPDLQELLESEALVVDASEVHSNGDGTFRLTSEPYHRGTASDGSQHALCPDSRFYGETHATNQHNFRSATLVGPDLILTSWHIPFPPDIDVKAIFGLHSRPLAGGGCAPADFDHIPADAVFDVVGPAVADGDPIDFVLLRLRRAALGQRVLRVRRSGLPTAPSRATTVGHPERLAAKVDLAGTIFGSNSQGWPILDGLHALVGSSGSMVYNRDQRMIESTVAHGRCGDYDHGNDPRDCWTMIDACPPPGTENASLAVFAQHIPPFELLVEPLDDVVHVAAVGGPVSNPLTTRTVRAPDSGDLPLVYRVRPPATPGPGEPQLELQPTAPLSGTLAPGASFDIRELAGAANVPCGFYTRTYAVSDLSHGFVDPVRHRFEIGVREARITRLNSGGPGSGLEGTVYDIAPPFEDTATYELVNLRPTPATVTVKATTDFLTLNGIDATGPGQPVEIQMALPPAGSDSASATVVQGYGELAKSLPIGSSNPAQVQFTIESPDGCPVLGEQSFGLRFVYGVESFDDPTDVPIPDGSPFGLTRLLQVPETFCVGDLNVHLETRGAQSSQLRVQLSAPDGMLVTLWNHNGSGDLNVTLDDEATPPPTGQLLSAFDGHAGGGTWRLRVFDDVRDPPGPLAEMLSDWDLAFTAAPCVH